MTDTTNLESELAQFTGTEQYYRAMFIKFTDGIKYLADKAGAYWLIDAIGSHQPGVIRKGGMPAREFQLWTLTRNKTGGGAVLECRGDTDGPVWARQRIPYTDFPMPSIKLYVENGVLLLPSEH